MSIADAHSDKINCIELVNQSVLATGSDDHDINFWNPINYTRVGRIRTPNAVKSLKTLSNGYVATSSQGNSISVWNTDSWSLFTTLTGHTGNIMTLYQLSVSCNSLFLSGSSDNTFRAWDYEKILKGTSYSDSYTFGQQINAFEELPNGDVAVAGNEGLLQFWYMGSWVYKETSMLFPNTDILSLTLYNSLTLVVGLSNGSIALVDISSGKFSKYNIIKTLDSPTNGNEILCLKVTGKNNGR
jgi:WD40 repeat protein